MVIATVAVKLQTANFIVALVVSASIGIYLLFIYYVICSYSAVLIALVTSEGPVVRASCRAAEIHLAETGPSYRGRACRRAKLDAHERDDRYIWGSWACDAECEQRVFPLFSYSDTESSVFLYRGNDHNIDVTGLALSCSYWPKAPVGSRSRTLRISNAKANCLLFLCRP